MASSPYRLLRTPPPAAVPPRLDPDQQRVVDHPGGPLLVLAGPGTGKTTTLVEAVAARVERGLTPEQVLVLTFSRKAADELRARTALRLGRTVGRPSAWTFHSWCLALIVEFGDGSAPRLLSGPERLVRVRELLRGAARGDGTTSWPSGFLPALETAGFAREVADLLDRARERGLEPHDLRALGGAAGRPEWVAAADFFDEYVAVLGAAGEMDYGELVRSALRLLDDPAVLESVRARHRVVFVDEYQDTDPAQEELLALLAGGGGDLVVVGDPDQSIYAFRGADVSCLLGFPSRFPTAGGRPAPTLTLGVSRRAGGELVAVSRSVAGRIPAPGLPVDALRRHRALQGAGPPGGTAEVRLYATAADEAASIADVLRRAHLEDGLPWQEMAVLVRSGRRSLPPLRRSLVAAGVPVAVAADEVPVARDPAVAPLLLALRCAADPRVLDAAAAELLLLSPLVRASAADLRRLGRALRRLERESLAAAAPEGAVALPRAAAELIREAVVDGGTHLLLDDRVGRPLTRLAALLAAARVALADGGVEDALWAVWDGSRWAGRLAAASRAGGPAGRAADRDLDAVVALFDAVARLEERRPRAGLDVLLDELEAQEIPSETRAEGALAAAGAVRLLTAHRSKGLEWDLVVVAGVQDGGWPDLRRRGSLLEPDRLRRDQVAAAPSRAALLVEERRLFYVAVTRARWRLVVTAVRALDGDAERPSRFLDELGLPVPERAERAAGSLSLSSLVARLRRAGIDPALSTAARAAAAAELARLAAPAPDGEGRLVPVAHPSAWWGLAELTPGVGPVRPVGEPLALSGSAVSAYDTCPLAWFLEREAKAALPSTTAQGFGLVVHALARLVATGAVPPEVEPVLERLDAVWPSLGFDAPWQSVRERRQAAEAIERFLAWQRTGDRSFIAAEAGFVVPLADAVLRGSIDRLDRDPEGRVRVVDFKTGATVAAREEVERNAQLAVYQLALREGGLREHVGDDAEPGGAELVFLRKGTAKGLPTVRDQPPLLPSVDAPSWADELVRSVAAGVAGEEFPARVNPGCDRCAFRRACPAQGAGGSVVA